MHSQAENTVSPRQEQTRRAERERDVVYAPGWGLSSRDDHIQRRHRIMTPDHAGDLTLSPPSQAVEEEERP